MELDALIVASNDDLHSQVVKQEIELQGGNVEIIDTSAFPSCITICSSNNSPASPLLIELDNKTLEITDRCSVWWRRPRSHSVSTLVSHPKLESFVVDECRQAFLGSLILHSYRVVNPMGASRQATVKLAHLKMAQEMGFRVPKTLVTNNPDIARDFINKSEDYGGCIYKPFTGTDFGFFETRAFSSNDDIEELWRIKHCPMLIQEHIRGPLDIRVTVVGNKVFSSSMDLSRSLHGIDGRVERLPAAPFELDRRVENKIVELVKKLGLFYSAIDFRLDQNGELVFFEVNPEGQYLWIEIDTGLQISRAMADLLLEGR